MTIYNKKEEKFKKMLKLVVEKKSLTVTNGWNHYNKKIEKLDKEIRKLELEDIYDKELRITTNQMFEIIQSILKDVVYIRNNLPKTSYKEKLDFYEIKNYEVEVQLEALTKAEIVKFRSIEIEENRFNYYAVLQTLTMNQWYAHHWDTDVEDLRWIVNKCYEYAEQSHLDIDLVMSRIKRLEDLIEEKMQKI